MASYESSMENLAKAQLKCRPPRPWRSRQDARMIRRYVFLWHTRRGQRPSGREWARQLRISHAWLQKLVRKCTVDPTEMYREQQRYGSLTFAQLSRAQEDTNEMRERGELRLSRLA